MKLELETTIEAVTTVNRDLMIRTAHVQAGVDLSAQFIRSVEAGFPIEEARQLFIGRKVKITVELMPTEG